MAKQKLTPTAKRMKAARDKRAAMTPIRRKKKAENQRKRRAAKKAGKNIRGKDYDHKDKKFKSVKAIVVTMVMALKKNREVPYTKLLTKNKPK